MTKEELFSMCRLEEITPHNLALCEPFECENKDLKEKNKSCTTTNFFVAKACEKATCNSSVNNS